MHALLAKKLKFWTCFRHVGDVVATWSRHNGSKKKRKKDDFWQLTTFKAIDEASKAVMILSLSPSLEQPNSLLSRSSSLDLHSSKNIYTHWSRSRHIGTTFSSSASLFVLTNCGFSCLGALETSLYKKIKTCFLNFFFFFFGRKTRLNRLNANHSVTKTLGIVKSQQILHHNFLFFFWMILLILIIIYFLYIG